MKFRGFVLLVLLATILLVAAYYPPTTVDNEQKEAILMQTILAGLKQLHYDPIDLDDEFSGNLYDMYLERLDGGKRWLTQQDVKELEQYRLQLDNEANEGSYAFLSLAIDKKEKALAKTEKYFTDILAKPFDFSKSGDIERDGDKRAYAKDDQELYENWEKSLKYEVLTRFIDKIEDQKKKIEKKANPSMEEETTTSEEGTEESEEEEEFVIKSEEELEKEAREAVLKTYSDWYDRLEKRKRKDHLSDYLKAFSNSFDPHTEYFLPVDKQTFDMNMSGRLEGIGARLQETIEKGAKVVHIVPGGPAWQGKELEMNDHIHKVSQGKNGEWVDVTGWTINDIVSKIRGKKGTTVRLGLEKADGSKIEISIVRDEIIMDEGFVKSTIIDIPDVIENIGYVQKMWKKS